MSSTQVNSTSSSTSSISKTSGTSGQITNPAFFGYESLSVVGNSVAYTSKDCQSASTFSTTDSYVACCSGPCTPFTGCSAGSTLVGPSRTSICSPSLTCKTDIVYPTESAVGGLAIYCGTGPAHTWYRALPSNGIDSSIPSSTGTPRSGSGTSLGGPVGGAVGGVFLLVVIGILVCVCASCGRGGGNSRGGGGGGGGSYSGYENDEYERQQREQIRIGYLQDQQERDRLASYNN